jgi:hypothetical protein
VSRLSSINRNSAELAPWMWHGRNCSKGRFRGTNARMRIGNVEVRPLGGGAGCLLMILASIVLSLLLTFVVNVLL